MNLAKSFSIAQTSNPSLLIAILQETLLRLPQVQGQALCNALQGAATAAASPTYAAYADVIGDITSHLCKDHWRPLAGASACRPSTPWRRILRRWIKRQK